VKSHAFVILCLAAVAVAHAQPRLVNLSTRAQAGTGDAVLTAGFVITGGTKQVLVRAVGPSLGAAPFNLPGVLADPQLTLFGPDSGTHIAATNDNWNAADAATFSAVGAFNLVAGSKDSAIVATLAPGNYTAQVTGAGGTTGLALVEVYEVTASGGRLINISTRAQVGTGATVMIPGIVVSAGGGTRRFLVRASGPALAGFGLTGALADPTITLTTQAGTPLATNDNWGTPVGTGAADGPTLATAFTLAGAFPFPNGSKDAALLVDLGAGNYGIQVSGAGSATGLALVEVYDLTPSTSPTVTVVASDATADESGSNPGEYTFTRTGDTLQPLVVNYALGGSAANGYDYAVLPGAITIPAGAASAKLTLSPNPTVEPGDKTAVLSVAVGAGYAAGAPNSATVSIAYVPATLYVAALRPITGATGSTASGTATILLSASGTLAGVNVAFSTLSSAEVTAHLTVGTNQDFVLALPYGEVNGVQWYFSPSGPYTSSDLLSALKTGNLAVRIDTANYPTGEVRGTFIQGAGAQNFIPPGAPPAVTLTNVTAADSARLLTQATFGPKQSEIDALKGASIDAWITTQLTLPFTAHRTAMLNDHTTYGGSSSFTNWNALFAGNRQAAWWKTVLTAPDQLRQRVAFALSELFVISDVSLGNDNQAEPLAAYYDLLGNDAFGNFRTLLNDVTLSPMMGNYLSSLRNAKADPTTGQTPDENYAREVMQLFTIGLNMLNPDGTLQLDASGLPIPTYNQTTVTEMAKVFTGWAYFNTSLTAANFRGGRTDYFNPMVQYPTFHDLTQKNIVNGVVLPAGQDGVTDLKQALDALFFHPNTGPFVARALIQRLVTSNPSPAYVYRVAQVFADDGTGAHTRGNLAAVVRAILSDYEARSPVVAANLSFGKLKEPILRLANVLRSFNASAPDGRFVGFRATVNGVAIDGSTPQPATQSSISVFSSATRLDNVQVNLDQAALRSPTVFNFFHPAYVEPGALASAGLVAPEFEITDATFSIDVPNFLRTFVLAQNTTGTAAPVTLALDLSSEQTLVATPSALLDRLAAVLCGGTMPQATRDRITTALAALPASTDAPTRAQTAVLLTLTSPAAAVQH
jgi:uncharacterized protein (DUF1800 family)